MGTLWPRVERKERKTRGKRETDAEKERERRRRRERDTERERSRASCSHYLTYYTGSMPPRPVPRPHFTSLGFTWLSLRASHRLALRLLVLPPSRRAPPPSSHTRPPFAPSSPSSHARARARDRFPLPRGFPPLLYRRLLLRASTSPFLLPRRRSHPAPLLPVPPRPPPPNILIDRSCTRAQRSASSYRLVSSRLPRLASLLSLPFLASFFFLFPLSFYLALFPPPLLPSSSTPSPGPLARHLPSLSARPARYKLFQKFVLLLLSLNHSQRRRAGDGHSSPVQCATLFAPRRLRQFDDSEGGDGDDESWTSGVSLLVSLQRDTPGSIFTRVTFFFSLARTNCGAWGHYVSTRLICMNTDENPLREKRILST